VRVKLGKDPRQYSTTTKDFLDDGNGNIKGVNTVQVEWTKTPTGQWKMNEVEGSEKYYAADLILLAMGFLGPEKNVPTDIGELLYACTATSTASLRRYLFRTSIGQSRKHQNHQRNLWNAE